MEAKTTVDNPTRITLLTQQDCGFCEDAKAILSRLAVEYPLTIDIVDLRSQLGEELAVRGGVLFPPGIFLDGEAFCYGRLSERKLRRELERRVARTTA